MADKIGFGDLLSGLCAAELDAAKQDPERIGAMIERLANSLAFTIAIAAGGERKRMDALLNGAEGYMVEAAADHQRVAAFLGGAGSTKLPPGLAHD